MIPAPFGTAMVYLGPCTVFSPFSCHFGHSIMMNAQTYSLYVVATSFFYRLYILQQYVKYTYMFISCSVFSKAPTKRTMIGICVIMMLLPICMSVSCHW